MVDRSAAAVREREQLRRQSPPSPRVAPGRRRSAAEVSPPRGRRGRRRRSGLLVLVLAVLVLAVLAAGTAPWLLGRSGSPGALVPLPQPGAVPLAYHVVYRVTTGSVVSTEELWVHRPFEADDVVF